MRTTTGNRPIRLWAKVISRRVELYSSSEDRVSLERIILRQSFSLMEISLAFMVSALIMILGIGKLMIINRPKT